MSKTGSVTGVKRLPKVELLMMLERIRNFPRTGAGAPRIRGAIYQAEQAIKAAEEMKHALRVLMTRRDNGKAAAAMAIAQYLNAVPESNDEPLSRGETSQGETVP